MLGDGIRSNIATRFDEERTLFVRRGVAQWRGSIALFLVLGLGIRWSAQAATFTTFDVPGAVIAYPVSINPAGAITGYYADASYLFHGFLRASDSTVTTFAAAPGAVHTYPASINPAGAITGVYMDPSFAVHGFLRAPDGIFTTLDVPGALHTYPFSINPAGVITGFYVDANHVGHGFLRNP